jgi:tetratricopeptide (TPR) repeat protein
MTYHRLASLQLRFRLLDQSLQSSQKSAAIHKKLVKQNPGVWIYRVELARAYYSSGEAHESGGQSAEAVANYKACAGYLEPVVMKNPNVVGYRDSLRFAYLKLAELYRRLGNQDRELVYRNHLIVLTESIPEEQRRTADWGCLAQSLFRIGKLAESKSVFLRIVEEQGESTPTLADGPRWWYLAMLLAHEGQQGKALEYYSHLSTELTWFRERIQLSRIEMESPLRAPEAYFIETNERLRMELATLLDLNLTSSDRVIRRTVESPQATPVLSSREAE